MERLMPYSSSTGGQINGELGRTVGLFSAQVPRELLYALGCTPVRVFPTAGKPTAAEAFLPRNFCALTRLILASFLEDGALSLDAVVFADEDDATRRLHDVWHTCVPVPVWGFVEVPRATTSLAISRYAGILAGLAADLAAHTRGSLTAGTLRQAIAVYNEQRRLLADLKRRWLAGGVNTTTYRRLRQMALTKDPVAANRRLGGTLKGIGAGETQTGASSLPDASAPPLPRRLLLLAELAAPAGLVRLVEGRGARVVAEDSDLDEQDLVEPLPADAETVGGLLAALANAYLTKPPGPRMRDLPRRMAHLTQLVAGRGVQAAICAYSKFCDLYLAEYPVLKAHLEGLGVPVLLLELEDDAISGQHRTRVEAFLEMMQEQRF
jgi:benzoyl-CoA reductase/2-hydroxyglutaryl-CoA dehydratase subunit BcrC/BadD/HgdB